MEFFQPNQQSVEIWPIAFQNDDPINSQLENTGKNAGALQPTYPLHYFVYPISEENSSNPCNLLMCFKKNR